MPTASSAILLGVFESFEPVTANLFTRRVGQGEFLIVNKYLVNELLELGLWNRDMIDKIIANQGSIQNIMVIPEDIRYRYKDVWEIPQKVLLDLSIIRNKYVDQSQSLNVYHLDAKMRVFAPVIVRGEEEQGTRLWEFGKEIYQQLLGIAADEDYGDFTDIQDGRDFTVEATNGEVAGRSVVKCALRPKPKTSPITDNATLLQTLLDEQPDILTINRRYTFDDLKTILEKFLNPEDDIEDNVPVVANTVADSAEPSDLPWEKPEAKPYTLENVAPKATNTDKFDELF